MFCSYIGTLDIIGVSTGPQKTIDIDILPDQQMCGSKNCYQWINFDSEDQVLTLNKESEQSINLEVKNTF